MLGRDEVTFPFERLTRFEGLEDQTRLIADPLALRDAYLAEVDGFRRDLRRVCLANRIDLVEIDTAGSLGRGPRGLPRPPRGPEAGMSAAGPCPSPSSSTRGSSPWGAGLVAVPILIHLLSRRRVQRVPWAAMQWLLAAVRRHQRRLRMENWLVLLLRSLAVLLLGLGPRPAGPDRPRRSRASSARARSLYLVLDTSYSMAAQTEGRAVARPREGRGRARSLGTLGADDPVAVVVTNDPRLDVSDGRRAALRPPPHRAARTGWRAPSRRSPRSAPARPRRDWAATLAAGARRRCWRRT